MIFATVGYFSQTSNELSPSPVAKINENCLLISVDPLKKQNLNQFSHCAHPVNGLEQQIGHYKQSVIDGKQSNQHEEY